MNTLRDDFYARQVDYLVADGAARDAAEQRVAALVPRPESSSGRRPRRDALADHLGSLAGTLGPALPEVEAGMREFQREVAQAFAPVWQSYRGVTLHFGVVAALGFGMVWVMTTFVLPQMEATYRSFGADLPPITRLALAWGDSVVVPLVLALLTLAAWWLPRRVQAAVELRRPPMPLWLNGLLLGGRQRDLWVAYEIAFARAALRAGFEAGSALELADRYARGWHGRAGLWGGEALEQARIAACLGTLPKELRHQLAERWRDLPLRAAERREWVALAVSLLLGLAVAVVLVALYLPIFKISSVM